ncbi:protein ENTREP3 isoform X12 [Macaca fascicularis]|uniref:protein ENTREP3 isoform X12 n=1 Tax=Macaca fascicularis TaxID=9541 RepID=UPI003D154B2E
MMPSPSDSSRSLTSRPSTRGLTHLRLHRPWLQALLTLGLVQVLLGILVVTFSMVASSVTTTESIKRSCPSWAGFSNLLFSVCGLTICAAIICTLSAIVCCIQIFSLDLVHTLAPERSVSGPLGPLGCTSPPPAPLLHTMLDLEEFVPPVPPPPYYPPEYTCSSETDAQSITYNGSMDSPVPLYPTDCPPSYEAVMGLRGDSQATLFDPQLHDGSCICERVASIVDADFRDLYTKVLEEEAASVSSADTGLCSEACLFRLARCPSPKLLRARSAEKRRPVPTFQKVPLPSGPAPAHSLGDLKGSWPGQGLVTRFLQISRKAPDPSGTGAHGHKQMPRSLWGRPGRESLHLRSCGDLSSGSSLRRLLSGRRLERGTRPHSLSLNGGSRETGL